MSIRTIFFSPNSYLTTIALITEAALIAHKVVCAPVAPEETTPMPELHQVPRVHDLAIFD
jgi:hypothetical protein